ncbi:SRPBCC family protein [Bradyrhizobium sp. G127]|jgi:uncharacterized protein YndB with AHSA1/START domain|uniref:SRPBCC family protein n=1 Tax=Bradyrhizobium sp. G127 TaxID=2904800 RepID=UPI001F29C828|nr:SRPBCC family protein [Bradyrhizobium sp. G127]MCF2522143.1 SRPBCC family protein [Bradyrhizobium sp. G127]
MRKPDFIYVIYIQTSADKLWNALIDPEMTKDYWWRHRNRSDWKEGSTWSHENYDDPAKVDIVGTVIESKPPHRLVLTWANPAKASDPSKVSRVTFDIEALNHEVRLTVTHDETYPEMLKAISGGWPAVLSSLKTMLETGKALPMALDRQPIKAPEATGAAS